MQVGEPGACQKLAHRGVERRVIGGGGGGPRAEHDIPTRQQVREHVPGRFAQPALDAVAYNGIADTLADREADPRWRLHRAGGGRFRRQIRMLLVGLLRPCRLGRLTCITQSEER